MLLSYNEICELIEQGVVEGAKFDDVNAGSLDIHLGTDILYEQDTDNGLCIVDYRARQKLHMGKHVMDPENGYVLAARESVLASSAETFNLPNNVCAEYKLKSSMARIFLEHLNAGWCFVGSTGIPLLDGSTVPIASLVGKQFWVYSLDDCGEVVPGFVSRVWETKQVTSTVVVTLDSGDTFECTPDHRIMLRHGGYCEAQHLQPGAALMPFYRKLGQNDHEFVYCPSTVLKGKWKNPKGRWHKTHTLVDAALNGPLPAGYCVHHDNRNKADNSPGNLLRMTAKEHIALHNAERNRSPEQRRIVSETMTATNKRMWQDPEYATRKAIDNARNAARTNNKRWGTPTPDEYKNHKVVSVQHRRRRTPVPVYDMTVEEHHNFAIAAGVFVHNCDAGWNGSKLTLELCNLSRFHSIRIRPGDAIGQMVFFRHTEVPEDRSYAARGRYNGDTTVSAIKE